MLSIGRVQVLCKQLLILPQAASLKIGKRSALQNTPQEFFTSVLTPAPAKRDSSETTRGSKIILTLAQIDTGKVTTDTFTHKKHKQCIFFSPLTFFSLLLVSWCLCGGEKAEKQRCECVFVCKWQWKHRGSACQRVSVLASERAGKWEHNPDYGQAPDSLTHGSTKAEGKTNPFHREVIARSKASSVCVFPQGGGKTSQGLAAAKRGFVFDSDAW